jgi:hypothetical protein
MGVARVVLGILLALCSLAQGWQLSKKLRVIGSLPNDQVQLSVTLTDSAVWLPNYASQDSMETKIEMILTILADQQTAISDQKARPLTGL